MKETIQWIRKLLRRHVFVFLLGKYISKFINWWNILYHKDKVKFKQFFKNAVVEVAVRQYQKKLLCFRKNLTTIKKCPIVSSKEFKKAIVTLVK